MAAPGGDAAAVSVARALGTTTGGGVRARAERIAHMVRAWVAPDPDVAELRSIVEIGRPPRYLRDAAAVSASASTAAAGPSRSPDCTPRTRRSSSCSRRRATTRSS